MQKKKKTRCNKLPLLYGSSYDVDKATTTMVI